MKSFKKVCISTILKYYLEGNQRSPDSDVGSFRPSVWFLSTYSVDCLFQETQDLLAMELRIIQYFTIMFDLTSKLISYIPKYLLTKAGIPLRSTSRQVFYFNTALLINR